MGPKYIEIYDLVQASPDEYLMHHQIKGAKWGVHRGPPYPLQSGIRSKIKRITKAAEKRIQENRAQRTVAKERKAASKAEMKQTLQDKINKMSDEELRLRTERLRLENAYKRELPKEKEGKSFLQSSAKFFNNLNTASKAFGDFMKTGKELAKLFGLVEDKSKNDTSVDRLPGESIQDYSKRLASLASIKKSKENLGVNEQSSSVNFVKEKPGKSSTNEPSFVREGYFEDKVQRSDFDTWTKEDPDKKKKGG